MNWEMIGALGELLGAAAVVGTVFYLAHEVREASQEAQRARWSDLQNEISRVVQSWSDNSDLSNIVFRGFTDRDSLRPEEAFRFYSNLYPWFRAWETLFEYSEEGRLEEWRAQGTSMTMRDVLGFPGMRKYWADRRHWYSLAFQAEVDRLLVDAQPANLGAYMQSE
jgi:hypothetical protein